MGSAGVGNFLKLVVSILICLAAGFIGSFFTSHSVSTWYPMLDKPPFTPPNWVFMPVWTLLYLLMGVSLFLVWRQGTSYKIVRIGLVLFFVQLLLNLLWTLLFFGMRSPLAGLVDILILWVFIFLTMLAFFGVSRTAGILLLPYFLWVGFATLLNFSLWKLNQ
jgi:benzodiazapine receptor